VAHALGGAALVAQPSLAGAHAVGCAGGPGRRRGGRGRAASDDGMSGADVGAGAVALAAELVAERSDDPAGAASVAARLAARLDAAGLAVELDLANANVVARLPGGRALPGAVDRRPLCLSGHLDTVAATPADWARDPWSGDIADGLLHGRGASDMKGGVAAIVTAAEAWARRPADARPPLLVVLTGGEERGCEGARALARAGTLEPAGALIVAEPTGLAARPGHRGVLWLRAAFHGRAAHASTPQLGRNAISAAARSVLALEGLPHDDDPVLGPTSLSVGLIDGGVAPNLVPDRCEITIDVRTTPAAGSAVWRERIGSVLDGAADLAPLLSLDAVRSHGDEPALRALLTALGVDGFDVAAPFFTDASVLAGALDAPTLIWGPGDARLAHAADEHCAVDEIAQAARRLASLPEALGALEAR